MKSKTVQIIVTVDGIEVRRPKGVRVVIIDYAAEIDDKRIPQRVDKDGFSYVRTVYPA